jgi:hypothetical protein
MKKKLFENLSLRNANIDKNKLIRSLFILIGHQKMLRYVLREQDFCPIIPTLKQICWCNTNGVVLSISLVQPCFGLKMRPVHP